MADAASAVRVVITGGAGFLGSLLARRLLTSPPHPARRASRAGR